MCYPKRLATKLMNPRIRRLIGARENVIREVKRDQSFGNRDPGQHERNLLLLQRVGRDATYRAEGARNNTLRAAGAALGFQAGAAQVNHSFRKQYHL